MATSYTNLLGLALPVTGELSGTWGDTVNDYITQYLDAAVAGTQTISGSLTAVTLSKTTSAALTQAGSGATGSSQYQIINCTGNPASLLTITVPAASKVYLVLNNTSTSQSVKVVGTGPTTGVTVAAARAALIAWNGTDFELVGGTDASQLSGVLAAVNGGTGQSSYAVGDLLYASSATALSKLADVATGNALISGGVGAAPSYGKIGLTTHVSGTLPAANGGTGQSSYAVGDLLYASAATTVSKLADVATGNVLISGGVGAAPSYGKVGLTTHVSGTLPIANGGTNATATPTLGGVIVGTGTAYSSTAAGTAGQALVSNGGAAPTWQELTLANLPGAWVKKAVDCATTAALTINTAQTTIDGVTLSASSRVLVKNQAAPAENGIYTNLTTTSWTRTSDADSAAELAGATVSVDAGTTNGGYIWTTSFKTTDTLGTTAMNWYQNYDGSTVVPATNGGTGQTSYAVGDLLYASSSTAISKLADVATGNVLISGGVGAAPSYGKVGLTTHISGTLPIANGGTNATTAAGARTSLGATTVGSNMFTLTNPSAITFPRFNADNTVSALDAASFRTAIGAGTGGGSVSSVDVSGGTTGLTTSGGPITTTGTITLAGTLAAANGGTGQTSYAVGDLLYASATTTVSKLADVATGNVLLSGGVGAAPSYGKVGLTTHVSGTLPIANGGTNATATPTLGGVIVGTGTAYSSTAAGTAGQALVSNGGAAPTWQELTLENLPSAWVKRAVGAATTAALTINTAQTTIDGVTLSASTRVLVKNQAAPAENGIYTNLTTTSWTRASDADTAGDIAGAAVAVDAGTVNGGEIYVTTFKATDTLGTTAMNWYQNYDSSTTVPATNGGTGQTTYAVGDLLYASSTSALSKLADVATGNVLISGGVGVAPSYGKVGLTTHVSGTLAVGNGGTGATTLTGVVIGNGTSSFTAKTNPTGAFVGTTDTQTLTNKTLTSPIISQNVQVIGTNTTAVASRIYVLTASLTLTLPATPAAGDWVAVQNSSGTTTAVIARNGSNIMSLAENMTMDATNVPVTLVYADATRGWVLV